MKVLILIVVDNRLAPKQELAQSLLESFVLILIVVDNRLAPGLMTWDFIPRLWS